MPPHKTFGKMAPPGLLHEFSLGGRQLSLLCMFYHSQQEQCKCSHNKEAYCPTPHGGEPCRTCPWDKCHPKQLSFHCVLCHPTERTLQLLLQNSPLVLFCLCLGTKCCLSFSEEDKNKHPFIPDRTVAADQRTYPSSPVALLDLGEHG